MTKIINKLKSAMLDLVIDGDKDAFITKIKKIIDDYDVDVRALRELEESLKDF